MQSQYSHNSHNTVTIQSSAHSLKQTMSHDEMRHVRHDSFSAKITFCVVTEEELARHIIKRQ